MPTDPSDRDPHADPARGQSLVLHVDRASVGRAAWTGTLALCAATLGGFAGWVWPLELLSHFRLQYAWALAVLLLAWLAVRRPRRALAAGLGAALNASLIIPLYLDNTLAASTVTHPAVYRTVLLNVDVNSRATEPTRRFLESADADLLLLVEPSQRWLRALESVADGFPCREAVGVGFGYGIAFYSKLPCESIRAFDLSHQGRPSIIARLITPSGPLTVVGTHPRTPLTPRHLAERNRHLMDVAGLLANQSGPKMLMGDLNVTSWSTVFRTVCARAGLLDSRVGFGLQTSWPTFLPGMSIPIDHILLSPGIHVHDRQIGPEVGSDHRPVILEFSLDRPSGDDRVAPAPEGSSGGS